MRLLLDCHIARGTIGALRPRLPSLHVEHLATWWSGQFLRGSDEDILAMCHSQKRVLVTYDLRTIPNLLRMWATEQRSHSGIIFGDEQSIKPSQPGVVAGALARIVKELGNAETTNLIRFLRP